MHQSTHIFSEHIKARPRHFDRGLLFSKFDTVATDLLNEALRCLDCFQHFNILFLHVVLHGVEDILLVGVEYLGEFGHLFFEKVKSTQVNLSVFIMLMNPLTQHYLFAEKCFILFIHLKETIRVHLLHLIDPPVAEINQCGVVLLVASLFQDEKLNVGHSLFKLFLQRLV